MNRIKQITQRDSEIIKFIPSYSPKRVYFTLLDEDGYPAKNDEGHMIVYEPSMPEAEMAAIESYCYLRYWAEEETDCKKETILELITTDFTHPGLPEDLRIREGEVEYENYKNIFDGNLNAKPMKKLRRSIVGLHEAVSEIQRRMKKLSSYMEDLDEDREMGSYIPENPEEVQEEEYGDR